MIMKLEFIEVESHSFASEDDLSNENQAFVSTTNRQTTTGASHSANYNSLMMY